MSKPINPNKAVNQVVATISEGGQFGREEGRLVSQEGGVMKGRWYEKSNRSSARFN
jgi:hypothetical protein